MTHPLFKNLKNLYLYASTWAVVAVVHMLVLTLNQGLQWQWAIVDGLVFNSLYSALGLSFWYMCKYISLEKMSLIKIVENHAFASAFTSAIWLGISYVYVFHFVENYKSFLENSLIWRGLIGILFYLIIVSFYYVYIFSENYKEQLIKESYKAILKNGTSLPVSRSGHVRLKEILN